MANVNSFSGYRAVGLVAAIGISGGCVTTTNISQTDEIGPEHGVVVAKIHANVAGISVSILEDREANLVDYYIRSINGRNPVLATISNRQPPSSLVAMRVKAGRAFFSGPRRYNLFVRSPQYNSFSIEPMKVTYIGDYYVHWDTTNGWAVTKIVDEEKTTIPQARSEYPWLFEKYGYLNAVPGPKDVEAVDGYKRVKELDDVK